MADVFGWVCITPTPDDDETEECNGMCLYGADLGIPQYGDVAYAHPDCPAHGDPQGEDPAKDICGGGDESLRYVRQEDMEN